MKIKTDEDDRHQCIVIKHEYLKCHDTFERFRITAEDIILNGHTDVKAYQAYTYYGYFIFHLYEFIFACLARDYRDTDFIQGANQEKARERDAIIIHHTERLIQNKIDYINSGRAPEWENDVSHYENLLPVPEKFGTDFRKYRNKIVGHASFERTQSLNLTDFYLKYHAYVYRLYRDIGDYWGRSKNINNMGDVSNFFKAIVDNLNK